MLLLLVLAGQHRPEVALVGVEAADESAAQRKRLETQLANACSLFELGDITKAEYLERWERLQREIGAAADRR